MSSSGFLYKKQNILFTSKYQKRNISTYQKNAEEKEIWLDSVNGYSEHAHCLISLNKDQSISKVAQLIKGESSFWINKNKLIDSKFVWQDDYWAASVSESYLKKTREYKFNQERHHCKTTFEEEVDNFVKKHGLGYITS